MLSEITVTEVLTGIYDPQPAPEGKPGLKAPESLYGSRTMWAHLNRHRTHDGPLHYRRDHGIDYWARVTAPYSGLALWRGTERWRDQSWLDALVGGWERLWA